MRISDMTKLERKTWAYTAGPKKEIVYFLSYLGIVSGVSLHQLIADLEKHKP